MQLSDDDIDQLTNWRRKLHRLPEISGQEFETASQIRNFLADTLPDGVISGLGGTGVALIYNGREPGPTLMFRAELDALPIHEIGKWDHRSAIPGKGHMCGHDGHMAILAALGRMVSRNRPRRGRVVLLFQPAEETGLGAAAVIADEKFSGLRPDYSFALHNLPGLPKGHVWLKDGVANCASRGLRIKLSGRAAHASMPESGISPAVAVAKLIPSLTSLGKGDFGTEGFALATITHVTIGEATFGIAPGDAEVWVTLRTMTDDSMQQLTTTAESIVEEAVRDTGIATSLSYHDVFAHSENDPEAVQLLRQAMSAEGVPHRRGEAMRASEDFGRFAAVSRSAMFFLGAGEDVPNLHNPDYDFPDELISIGARIFARAVHDILS